MTYKSNMLTLVAAALLTMLPTACTDDLNGTGGTQGEGYGVPVQGISFFEAESFAEDTIAAHQPTMETNVEDAPDMDVMAYETIDVQTETSARRAAEENGGIMRHTLEEMQNAPTLAKALKQSQQARAKARRAAGNTPQEDHIVAGRKPLVPVRHKATADDSEQTRSFDVDEESAIFVMNDSVGVYELDASGNIVKANVKFVYNAGLWNCEAPLEYQTGHRYFAYHPYRTNEQLEAMGMTVDATAADYEGFFSDFADKWPVSDDQGTYEKYHACDLLAGKAVWNEETKTLGFPMHHLMGMLQLEFGVARIYLDWADEENYPYWWTDTVTTNLKNMTLLPKFVGKYRRITRPETELTVVAADSAWTLHFDAEKSISRGHYQHYDIGKTRSNDTEFYQIFYNQLGDILLQDGRLMHRHDWRRIQPNHPVGIVVGTVYPAVNPYEETIVGPLETNPDGTLYNCHSLERDFVYTMDVDKITHYIDPQKTVVTLKAKFVRCLVMSLKDVSYSDGSTISFPANWCAPWSWEDAIAHMPNTHVPEVSSPMYNKDPLVQRYNNFWYPDMRTDMRTSNWAAVAACEAFNSLDPKTGSGVRTEGPNQNTPNSGWFIGTCGQYQMAFCFGRERAFGDSWKNAVPHGAEYTCLPDEDGAIPAWQGPFYNQQYSPLQQINTWQNSSTYTDNLTFKQGNNYSYTRYWYPEYGDVCPTAWHDFDRINNAMQYALGSPELYDKIEGGMSLNGKAYTTSTLRCDLSVQQRCFPQTVSNWDYSKQYFYYHDWTQLVTFQLSMNTNKMSRGRAYSLGCIDANTNGKIRPLMAL